MRDTDGSFDGQNTTLVGGIGNNDFSVWNAKPDGVTLYDYSIKVKSYTKDGQKVEYVEEEQPFRITYNGHARYDEISGQSQNLVALLVPRMYTITYNLGVNEDEIVTNMEDYMDMNGNFIDYYYWSRGKAITAAPKREGYIFTGWYDKDNKLVTTIDPSLSGDITLTAKWLVAPEFETLADAGYYSEARDSADKVGVISLNSKIKNITEFGSSIMNFGIYVYNESGENEVSAESADISTVVANEGWFHVIISNIAKENFGKTVLAKPFVVIKSDNGVNIHMGEEFFVSVEAVNKWLGNEDPYSN